MWMEALVGDPLAITNRPFFIIRRRRGCMAMKDAHKGPRTSFTPPASLRTGACRVLTLHCCDSFLVHTLVGIDHGIEGEVLFDVGAAAGAGDIVEVIDEGGGLGAFALFHQEA